MHHVNFRNFNEVCCFDLFPINVSLHNSTFTLQFQFGIVFIIVSGLLIAGGSIALAIITKNWTLLVVYSLVAFFNLVLATGYLNVRPYFYIFYVIGNVRTTQLYNKSNYLSGLSLGFRFFYSELRGYYIGQTRIDGFTEKIRAFGSGPVRNF